jgi:hypothetical protein
MVEPWDGLVRLLGANYVALKTPDIVTAALGGPSQQEATIVTLHPNGYSKAEWWSKLDDHCEATYGSKVSDKLKALFNSWKMHPDDSWGIDAEHKGDTAELVFTVRVPGITTTAIAVTVTAEVKMPYICKPDGKLLDKNRLSTKKITEGFARKLAKDILGGEPHPTEKLFNLYKSKSKHPCDKYIDVPTLLAHSKSVEAALIILRADMQYAAKSAGPASTPKAG